MSTQTTSGVRRRTITTYAGGTEQPQRWLNGKLQLDIDITKGEGVRLVQDRHSGKVHFRYGFSDHQGSTAGEKDAEGNVTSLEEYLLYGGSAGAVEKAEDIHERKCCYSGKERDATGLLYYGWRYYQRETGSWLWADPGELIDGINLFRFCRSNPVILKGDNGLQIYPVLSAFLTDISSGMGISVKANYQQLDEKSLPQKIVPVAVWADRIYIMDAGKHMAIRPTEERGFPDFVGTLSPDRVMVNSTGNYRTPDTAFEHVKASLETVLLIV